MECPDQLRTIVCVGQSHRDSLRARDVLEFFSPMINAQPQAPAWIPEAGTRDWALNNNSQ